MSNMNGGVMRSQWARVGAGYMPPARPFAQLPNPDSVIGQVYIASDVGPAPGIELIAAPGRWRPRGGRQVLAMRGLDPVTVQNLTNSTIESAGPFPGGLVRAGMTLEVDWRVLTPGIGSGARICTMRLNDQTFAWSATSASGAFLQGRINGVLVVSSDTSAAHFGSMGSSAGSFIMGSPTQLSPVVDFSQPWSLNLVGQSSAETAVAISSATWAGGIATFNTSAAHTLAVGDKTVTAGVTPSGYNGEFIVATVPTTTQFTVAMAADPGTYTSGGTSSRISNMISQSYVLELVG